jgi:glycosyltransferase involved in cell wall biosynthesis
VPRYLVQTDSCQMTGLVTSHVRQHDAAIALQLNAASYLQEWSDIPRVFEEAEVTVFRERCVAEPHVFSRWRHRLTWWKFQGFVRGLVNTFDRTTVVSERERDQLRAIGCDVARVAIVPNGAEVSDGRRRAGQCSRLIYPGSVVYSANLDAVRYFIRNVFPLVRRSCPDASFYVTGSTDGVDIRDLANIDRVTFTGNLASVDSLIAESAVCVVPLRIGGGTRLKILQAMALGTPVVSTSKGVEGLDVEPEQHLLVADDASAFADRVVRVIRDSSLADRLAENGRRLVNQRYAWERIGDALESVLQHAVFAHRMRRGGLAAATAP